MDIGANLVDEMYQGYYHGSEKHAADLADVIKRADAAEVDFVVTCGCLGDIDLFEAHVKPLRPNAKYTIGIHPTRARTYNAETEKSLRYLLDKKDPNVVMYGELGLDYDRLKFASMLQQKVAFRAQLRLSREYKLPLFLHCRAASADFWEILLSEYPVEELRGVVHSFDGGEEEVKRIIGIPGLFIGINGCSMKTEESLRVIQQIPLDKILVETDCPWCEIKPTHASHPLVQTQVFKGAVKPEKYTPRAFVKGRNEPVGLVMVEEAVAALLKTTQEEVRRVSLENWKRMITPPQ